MKSELFVDLVVSEENLGIEIRDEFQEQDVPVGFTQWCGIAK